MTEIEGTAVAIRTAAKFKLSVVLSVTAAVDWDVTPCGLVQVGRFATRRLCPLGR